MGVDEEGMLERLKARRRELVDPKIREHRGRMIDALSTLIARQPWQTNPQFAALRDKTIYVGLRRAGMPEE